MKTLLADRYNSHAIRSRAEFARNIEYVRSMLEDTALEDRMNMIDDLSGSFNEAEDLDVLERIDERIPCDGDEDKEAEIKAIVNSDKDLSIDEIMNIQSMTDKEITECVDYILTEGTNLDAFKFKHGILKDVKKELSLVKKLYKKGDINQAIRHMATVKKLYEKAGKDIDKIIKQSRGDIPPVIIGYFIRSAVKALITIALTLLTLPLFGVGGTLYMFGATINGIVGTLNGCLDSYKKHGKIGVEDFNFYFNTIKSSYSRLGDSIDKVSDQLAEERSNKSKK